MINLDEIRSTLPARSGERITPMQSQVIERLNLNLGPFKDSAEYNRQVQAFLDRWESSVVMFEAWAESRGFNIDRVLSAESNLGSIRYHSRQTDAARELWVRLNNVGEENDS